MKMHYGLILLVSLVLSGCGSVPSPTVEQALPSATAQVEAATATPFPTDTQTPKLVFTPSATRTPTQINELSSSPSPTPTLLPYTPEPTPTPPSLSKLQIINRTNVSKLIPVWRYEPAGDPGQAGSMQFDFSSDGEKIAFLENHLPVLIDIQTAQRVRTFSLEGLFPPDNQPPVLKVLFSPDGKRLAGYTDFGLVLWDVSTGKPLWKADWSTARNYGQQGIDLTTSVTFSPDGDLLVTTSIAADSDIRVWSAKTGKLIKEVGMGNQRDAVFSPDGKRLYTADRITETEAIRIWDTESWRQIGVVYVPGQAFSTVLSTNGETMVVGSMDTGYGPMRLEIYSVKGWKHIGTIEDLDPGGVGQKPIYTYPTLNRDGGIVAFATDEFVVQLWDVTNQKHIMSLEGKSPTPIWTVRFSPDGRLLAAQGENGKIIFWGVPSQ